MNHSTAPHTLPAQRPLLGGEAAALGKGVGGAAFSDVRLQENAQAGWVGVVEGAVPASQVEQAGAGEGSGEVQQSPAVLADVEAGGVEFRVDPAKRGDRRPGRASLGSLSDAVERVLDIVHVLPPFGLAELAQVVQRPARQNPEPFVVEYAERRSGPGEVPPANWTAGVYAAGTRLCLSRDLVSSGVTYP
jgi:hypothetical protein